MLDRRAVTGGLAAALAAGTAAARPPLTVFAAASLQESLTAACAAWTKASGVQARLSFGASSAMARQIGQGAPADLFLSADEEWMDWLADRKLIVLASRLDLLSNRLVLIAPVASKTKLTVKPGMPLARALGRGRLALADPAAVPAGKYARTALTRLGVWNSVDDRVLPAENVRTALAYVARGEAPLGIVYTTDAKAEPRVRVVGVFPQNTHPRIVYPGAIVARSRNARAGALLRWLQGPQASAVFRRYGFGVLARPG